MFRSPRTLVFSGVLLACSAAPRATVDTPIPLMPAAKEPDPRECMVDVNCGAGKVCEANKCVTWSVEQLRAWAKTTGVEVPESVPPPPDLEGVAWIDRTKANVLYADGALFWPTVNKCVPLKMTWSEGALVGGVAAKFGENPDGNGVVRYTLRINSTAILSGPGAITKTKDGESGWGIGEANQLGHHLSPPFDDGLRYRGWLVRKTVACVTGNLQSDARCQACYRCKAYELRDVSMEPGAMLGFAKPTKAIETPSGDPVCVPCPTIDEREEKLARFKPLTANLETLGEHTSDTGPAFYRKAAACEADRKARAKPP